MRNAKIFLVASDSFYQLHSYMCCHLCPALLFYFPGMLPKKLNCNTETTSLLSIACSFRSHCEALAAVAKFGDYVLNHLLIKLLGQIRLT